jgi:hypothetical protein
MNTRNKTTRNNPLWRELRTGWDNFLAEIEGRELPHPTMPEGNCELDGRGIVTEFNPHDETAHYPNFVGLNFFDDLAPTREIKDFRFEYPEFLEGRMRLFEKFGLPDGGQVTFLRASRDLAIVILKGGAP